MINYIYILILAISFDHINLFFDQFIIFLLANFIIIKGISYKKSNFKDFLLIIVSSIILDFIAFNYIFSFYLLTLFPIMLLNKFIDSYNFTKVIASFSSLILSLVILFVFGMNFNLHLIFLLIICILIVFINLLLLKYNEFKLR